MSSNLQVIILKSQISRLGGLEKYTMRLAKAFIDKNCSVTILTTGPLPEAMHPDIQAVSHCLSSSLSVQKVKEFDAFCQEYLEKNPCEIVFGMDRNSSQTHLRAGNGVHAAFLKNRSHSDPFWKRFTYRLNPLHRLILRIEKMSFEDRSLKTLFVNSHMVKSEILERYAVDPAKIQVIHNGVEWKEMERDFSQWEEMREGLLKELKLDKEAFKFLFIGHNWKRKGLEKLLLGLSKLKEKNVHLSVVGKEKDIPYFQNLCQRLSLEKKVSFFGQRSDVRHFYQMADALVIPSFYDPFANVTVEALAMGLFVVSSKTNGGHEILTPENGTVIEDLSDEDSVASALEKALTFKKSKESALRIRESVSHLDFSSQLSLFLTRTLS